MTAARAFLGMSHSPRMGLNPIAPRIAVELDAAIAEARDQVVRWAPDRVVLIVPDHYNGFFNELMPPFCIGSAATSVGDYLTPAGPLQVAADTALALADHLMDASFDIAVSRRMQVDHGFVQLLQLLWGGLGDTPPVVPIFLNAVAQPGIPRLRRCQGGPAVNLQPGSLCARVVLPFDDGHMPPKTRPGNVQYMLSDPIPFPTHRCRATAPRPRVRADGFDHRRASRDWR